VFAILDLEEMVSTVQVDTQKFLLFNKKIFFKDACLNFCLNDGVCRKNKLGHVECSCKENFSGERCEIRFQVTKHYTHPNGKYLLSQIPILCIESIFLFNDPLVNETLVPKPPKEPMSYGPHNLK